MYFPLFVGVLCLSLLCYALHCVYFSFAIILKRKRKLIALLLLSYSCIVTINVLWRFLTVPWVCLNCVIVVFSIHNNLPFGILIFMSWMKTTPECFKVKHLYFTIF